MFCAARVGVGGVVADEVGGGLLQLIEEKCDVKRAVRRAKNDADVGLPEYKNFEKNKILWKDIKRVRKWKGRAGEICKQVVVV